MRASSYNFMSRLLNYLNRIIIGPFIKFFFIKSGLSKKYRILDTNCMAIGHLCFDVEFFLREKKEYGYLFRGILLAPRDLCANEIIVDLWSDKKNDLFVIRNKLLCYMLDNLRLYNETSFSCSKFQAGVGGALSAPEIFKIANNAPHIINWSNQLHKEASDLYEELFPELERNKIVLLHARDSYFDEITGNPNYFSQRFRNSDVKSYRDILQYLKLNGFEIIRVGDYYNDNMNLDVNYLDLTKLTGHKQTLLQTYLASECALYLGSASGAFHIAALWNRPIFCLNILSYNCLKLHKANSMVIPKLLSVDGRILCVKEIFDNGYHLLRRDDDYLKSGVNYIMNEPDAVLEDFKEFFQAFVLGDEKVRLRLINSWEQSCYSDASPEDNYDYYFKGLIGRNYFIKNQLF